MAKLPLNPGPISQIGAWRLIRFTGRIDQGVRIDMDKRCRRCGDAPFEGALGWINLLQPHIYCDPCFKMIHAWER